MLSAGIHFISDKSFERLRQIILSLGKIAVRQPGKIYKYFAKPAIRKNPVLADKNLAGRTAPESECLAALSQVGDLSRQPAVGP